MGNTINHSDTLLATIYEKYHADILHYIRYRITHKYEAEDLTQDVFMRLMDCRQMLRPETARFFLYTIARNIVIDYIRRYYKRQEIDYYLHETMQTYSNETEESILANDILRLEYRKMKTFPKQRRLVYYLNRYEECSVPEISDRLNLSRRTVENHLFIGRKEIRSYVKKSV
ncbi:RNA polymerase sigma-70 factor (family 1) [Parabacteroides sp. PFB2-12]|uniref:sigma-70 family RNA polymerase sigma factor n=1 Tax=unclassified Parabacteroides TaxID=2649774 RepID=UPI0024733F76|nr:MULTISPECIES: sigma-70 family RNA polymerase sigma factor [unclassified Parabacteroides]MDH6342653.1 RNA polymerase sigma-70 factor (family 1) [Parabacteroides sp. PM6-13]MDH6391782.1 RNA polymerase sigma-70 factor (family 1) [Parabacteroides sp. PFB2-12]